MSRAPDLPVSASGQPTPKPRWRRPTVQARLGSPSLLWRPPSRWLRPWRRCPGVPIGQQWRRRTRARPLRQLRRGTSRRRNNRLGGLMLDCWWSRFDLAAAIARNGYALPIALDHAPRTIVVAPKDKGYCRRVRDDRGVPGGRPRRGQRTIPRNPARQDFVARPHLSSRVVAPKRLDHHALGASDRAHPPGGSRVSSCIFLWRFNMCTLGTIRRVAVPICGAFALLAAVLSQTAVAQSRFPIRNVQVDVAPLRASVGDPTASWVQQELPGELTQALAGRMTPRGGTLVVRVDSLTLGAKKESWAWDSISGVAMIGGVQWPLRATARYQFSAIDQAMVEESNRQRVTQVLQGLTYWLARDL
jgi:hypothetical protein